MNQECTTWQVISGYLRLSSRRWLNRVAHHISGQITWFRSKEKQPGRSATPRKVAGRGFIVISLLFLMQGLYMIYIQSIFLSNLATMVDKVSVSQPLAAAGVIVPVSEGQELPLDQSLAQVRHFGPKFWPEMISWVSPEHNHNLLKALLCILALAFIATFCNSLSLHVAQDLTLNRTEWLYYLPVHPRALFGAMIIKNAFANLFSFFIFLPLLTFMFVAAGFTWLVPFLSGGSILSINIVQGSMLLLISNWIQGRFDLTVQKNFRAWMGVVAMMFLLPLFLLLTNILPLPMWIVIMSLRLPDLALWLPPFSACLGGHHRLLAAGLSLVMMFAISTAVWWGAMRLSERLVRDGLIAEPGSYRGKRKKDRLNSGRNWLPAGLVGREIRLLLRDRQLFVTCLLVPLLLGGFQLYLLSGIFDTQTSFFRLLTVMLFAVSAYYMMTCSAFRVLCTEQEALWQIFALPVTIERLLFLKARFWAVLGTGCMVLMMAGIWLYGKYPLSARNLADAVMAIVGIFLFGLLAGGIGILGTHVEEKEEIKKIDMSSIMFYSMLVALYLPAFYNDTFWSRAGHLVLLVLLVMAVWQKVRDKAPFFLDPVENPKPNIDISDGLFAVFGFFHCQLLLMLLFSYIIILPTKLKLIAAYTGAGALVTTVSLVFFYRHRKEAVADILWGGSRQDNARGDGKALLTGCYYGLLAAMVGAFYTLSLAQLPFLHNFKEEATVAEGLLSGMNWLNLLLMLLCAPVFEEYIFRGLLFRGLQRHLPGWAALTGSAALFALVHPPVSVVPVFFLGLAAALAIVKSKSIVSPIAAHVVYNAAMVGMNLL